MSFSDIWGDNAAADVSVAGSMLRFVKKYTVAPGMIVKGWTVRVEPVPAQAVRFRRDLGKVRRVAVNRVNHPGRVAA